MDLHYILLGLPYINNNIIFTLIQDIMLSNIQKIKSNNFENISNLSYS